MTAKVMTLTDAQEQASIRTAASVILVRDSPAGLEAWLQSRAQGMTFAAGMTVFPGGGVEVGDDLLCPSDIELRHVRDAFGCTDNTARALVGAAVRETYEETGLLLTVPAADLSSLHSSVDSGQVHFKDLLARRDLRPAAEVLLPYAHWLTPPGKPRRYDTFFFVAPLPPRALAANLTTESDHAEWISPAVALNEFDEGLRGMLMPTRSVLRRLSEHATVDDLMTSGRGVAAPFVQPVRQPDGRLVAPGESSEG